MILDKIENVSNYLGLSERLNVGLNYILNTDFSKLATGKYEIDGDFIYAMVNEYEAMPENECKLEAHRKYIDIQFILEGEEQVGFLMKNKQVPTIAYSPEKDVLFYEEKVSFFPFVKGDFAIFFPSDLHQPGIQLNQKSAVRKVVVKVLV